MCFVLQIMQVFIVPFSPVSCISSIWVQIRSSVHHSQISSTYIPPSVSETKFRKQITQQTKLYFVYSKVYIFR